MKLYYYKDPKGNFGDDLNLWLWRQLIPDLFDNNDSILFVGIGTLLNHRIPQNPKKVVFGSGMGYGEIPILDNKWDIYCVRGPLTAQRLGLDASLAITDSALLLREVPLEEVQVLYSVSFMPHHSSIENADWRALSELAGVHYIDPTAPLEVVLNDIRRSNLIITEAMHGAIVADAFRVPWIPVRCYSHILEFKWQDWCGSLDLKYQPASITPIWDVERNFGWFPKVKNQSKRTLKSFGIWSTKWTSSPPRKSSNREVENGIKFLQQLSVAGHGVLSSESVFEQVLDRMRDKLELFRKDRNRGKWL